ncbi:phytoene dehydrogenase-like protein [Nocardia transvalensis]|uniref:Phytoene dehydrogenase-like protein n=1 Tax=Nocardia transvalensis TaxID=37333 RepID=A0A7W9PGM4_9NOCA|nr:NAD(P)/FAD-dependent oxidoreductase [Nocardia transvalensis]MBB5915695.1 phytoene dehydrogenase-like protein [Nocardia transvalensis]
MTTAVVVGSGPNGLAAGVTLARHGVEVTVLEATDTLGGGTASGEYTLPGLLHDHCSAVHPFAAAAPLLRSLELEKFGLRWRYAPVDLAHPLDEGRAGVLVRSVQDTALGLGVDARRWHRLYRPLSERIDDLIDETFQPPAHLPRHPISLARFGIPALASASLLAGLWRTEEAKALFGGACAHSFRPLTAPTSAALGLMFVAVNQRYGWPVASGGSRSIAEALAALLKSLGGKIETGVRVTAVSQLPPADMVLFNLGPHAVADLLEDRMPHRVQRAYRRYRYGPGAFKLDLAVQGGIPWTDERCGQAGTVHVAGSFAEMVVSERETNAGRMPERPFIIVGQQYLADPGRSRGDLHPIYAYAHVPHGFTGDATEAILRHIERFAPGFRDRIVAHSVTTTADLIATNPNFVGGDVIGGAATPFQLLTRPRVALDPYYTGVPGMFIASAAAPPGAGAHGTAGHNAALSALRRAGIPLLHNDFEKAHRHA